MPLSSRFSEKVQISYVTHLTEDGVDRRFIQEAVGHRCDTSTAIYTHVSGDFMNTALRKALGPDLDDHPSERRKES
jgi:site-specific recombinase XerD